MREAKRLLEELTKLIPPGIGQRHNITCGDNGLEVTLMVGDRYVPFLLEEEDLDRQSGDLLSLIAHSYSVAIAK